MIQARLLVIVAAFCWGLSGVTISFVQSASPWQVAFFRAFWFSISLFFFLDFKHIKVAFLNTTKLIFIAGLALGLCFVCYVYAMLEIGVSNAIFLMAAAPIFGVVFSWILVREVITLKAILAIGIAALGIYLIVDGNLSSGSVIGWLTGIGSPLFFGLYTAMLRTGKDGDMEAAMPWAGLTTMIISFYFIGPSGITTITFNDLIVTMVLGAVSIGLGFYLYTLGSRKLPAVELGLLALLEIIFGIPLAVFVGGQPITLSALIGGSCVLIAIISYIVSSKTHSVLE